jgi:hypothetical protein
MVCTSQSTHLQKQPLTGLRARCRQDTQELPHDGFQCDDKRLASVYLTGHCDCFTAPKSLTSARDTTKANGSECDRTTEYPLVNAQSWHSETLKDSSFSGPWAGEHPFAAHWRSSTATPTACTYVIDRRSIPVAKSSQVWPSTVCVPTVQHPRRGVIQARAWRNNEGDHLL